MKIIVTFSMYKKGFKRRWNPEEADALVNQVASEKGYRVREDLHYTVFDLCPNGSISMKWVEGRLTGFSRTDAVGAGFHAAVLDFLEIIAERGKLKLLTMDATGYAQSHDFLRLRAEYYYRRFTKLMERAALSGTGGSRILEWSLPDMWPVPIEGCWNSDVRPFTDLEIKGIAGSGMRMVFAKDFYIWNELEKDAYFYRNSGLALLNQACYYMPSSRSHEDQAVNDAVIGYLEKALSMDPGIPFPKKEYLEVCALAGHEPADVRGVWAMPEDLGIGCRRRQVYYILGNTMYGIPGHYLRAADSSLEVGHYFDGHGYGDHGYGDHDYRISLHSAGEHAAEFDETQFSLRTVLEEYHFQENGLEGRAVLLKPEEADGEVSYVLFGQVLNRNQRSDVTVRFRDMEEKEWALGLLKNIKGVK